MLTRNYLILAMAILLGTIAYGQGIVSAKYGTILSYGIGDSQGIDFNSTLEYDGFNTIYTYQKKSLENDKKTLSKNVFSKDRIHMVQMRLDDVGEWTLVDHQTDGSMSRSVIGAKGYLINRDQTNQKWTLIDEEKEILGYNCQKATTYYAGRNYTAWYASNIKNESGPWLLHGLPGMILEAYDESKEVHFYAKELTFLEVPLVKHLMVEGQPVNPEKYWKLYLAHRESMSENGRKMAEEFGAVNYQPLHYFERIELYPTE